MSKNAPANNAAPAKTDQKAEDLPGAKPTTVTDADGNDVSPAAAGGAPAPGSRANVDPESDLGKAIAADAAADGAIRAEDNAGEGRQPDGAAEASGAGTDPSVGEMVSLKTSGEFILQDPYSLKTLSSEASEVPRTAFTDDRLASGQLIEA